MAVAIFSPLTQFFDNNGDPLNGGTVTVQDAGTTSSRNIYTDAALTVAATNPVPLDSAGRPTQGVIYTAATAYKLILKNSAGSTIRTEDNLDPGVPVGSGVLAITNGGTGGATASAARAALGAVGTSDIEDLEAQVASLAGAAASSEKTQLAVGTTAQRPASPAAGQVRNNSTTSKFEGVITGSTFDNFMFETANLASTANVAAESNSAVYMRPDRAKYHPGIAKAWGSTTGGGTPALAAESYGVTSVTDGGTGTFTFNLSITMANANYTVIPVIYDSTTSVRYVSVSAKSTTSVTILVKDGSGNAADPGTGVGFMILGSL